MTARWTRSTSSALIRTGMAFTLAFTLAASVTAGPIQFDPSGSGPTYTTTGFGFGGGNGVAIGSIPNGGPVTVGQTFTFIYQTHLTSLLGVNNVAGLNSTFQVTEVAALSEKVTSVTTSGGTTTGTFAIDPSGINQVNIYENNAVTFNDVTGKGFTDGTLIMSLNATSFNPSQFSNFGSTQPFNSTGMGNTVPSGLGVDGSGSTSVNDNVNSGYNTTYFVSPVLTSSIISSNLTSFFDTVNPSFQLFNLKTSSYYTPNLGSINGASGPDIQFQISGITQSFTGAVPEPASIAMTVLGLGGFAFGSFVTRRRRAKA